MLNFKEFIQASAPMLPTNWTGSETGRDTDGKGILPGIDMAIKPVEKTGMIYDIKYTKNPIEIRFSGGNIKIPWDNLRKMLGTGDPLSKLQYGKTISVKYEHPGENSRIVGIKLY